MISMSIINELNDVLIVDAFKESVEGFVTLPLCVE